jgi:Fur family transcriptional regulator, ferric uptake regulator
VADRGEQKTTKESPRGGGSSWAELALAALESGDRRAGAARRAVVDLLQGEDCLLSAQEIADRLHSAGSRIGIASVYRALELLDSGGLVQRVELGQGSARYEAAMPGGHHHHHVVCESCGRITPFEDTGLERAIGRLAGRLDHRVRAHDVVIRGLCSRCSSASRSAA